MTDDERQRLARLIPNLKRRAFIYQTIRSFFNEQGFLEVDTPVRSPAIAPEKEIIPFESEGWFLCTSPELYMKRLLAAGYDKIYQFSHCFRKGERGNYHNPEFTLLEWYRQRCHLRADDERHRAVGNYRCWPGWESVTPCNIKVKILTFLCRGTGLRSPKLFKNMPVGTLLSIRTVQAF